MVMWIVNKWLASKLTKLLQSHNIAAIKAWAAKINAATSAALKAVEDDEVTSDEIDAVVEAFTNAR